MAQPRVPLNVCTAARLGNYALVQEWLVNGGDANLNLAPEFEEEEASAYAYGAAASHHHRRRLLHRRLLRRRLLRRRLLRRQLPW